MGDPLVIVRLPESALPRLPDVLATVTPKDGARFMAALELGYLAASADGLDDAERVTIARTLSRVTGIDADVATLHEHFADLEQAVFALGRRERLARTAADLETDADRAEAIVFAALVAMADGTLAAPELEVLAEAGAHFAWSADKIRALVDDAAARAGGAR
jgi:tellurite resistance protein